MLALAALLIAAPHARAQALDGADDPGERARFRFGALRFTPSIAVSNVGIDNNVFNDADSPKRDTTAAIGPAVEAWMKVGKARLSGKSNGQYLYFKEYDDQRAWNTTNELRIDLALARLKPFAAGAVINSRERPGYEIDSRARRLDRNGTLGLDIRLSGKTTVVVSGTQSLVKYDEDATFLGESLSDALDRLTNSEQLQFRYALTPLTTFVVTNEAIQDRFSVTTTRDADSIRVMPGFEMKPFALISGKVAVGVRRFNAHSTELPDFTGLVAAATLSYSVGATRLVTKWSRDLDFSYQAEEPYYALNDVSLSLTQRITRSWDAVVRSGWQSLAYRRVASAGSAAADEGRVDTGATYGAGIGYRLGDSVRLGIDANYYKRDSDAEGIRNYEGLRAGVSVSYGLPQ